MRHAALPTVLLLTGLIAPTVAAGDDGEWVRGGWVGFTETYASFFRLHLGPEGKGMLANASRARGDVEVYRYRLRWSLQGTKIKLDLKPIDPDCPPIRVKGRVSTNEIVLDVAPKASTSAGSVKTLRLYPEPVFENQLKLLQERMAETVEE